MSLLKYYGLRRQSEATTPLWDNAWKSRQHELLSLAADGDN
jgi:hypothetical protein